MKYEVCEIVLSKARLGKYARACNFDKSKTLRLYQFNIKLSQCFYGVIGIFEIVLRNAINEHYKQELGEDWIIKQKEKDSMLYHKNKEINKTYEELIRKDAYSNDVLVASFSFGFWTNLFTRHNYRAGNKSLLKIFPNKSHGLMDKDVYRELTEIREFRNRVAHYEPICFDSSGNVSTIFARHHYELICKYLVFMGIPSNSALGFIEKPDFIMQKIDEFKLQEEAGT